MTFETNSHAIGDHGLFVRMLCVHMLQHCRDCRDCTVWWWRCLEPVPISQSHNPLLRIRQYDAC